MHYNLVQMFIKAFKLNLTKFALFYSDTVLTYYQLLDKILELKRIIDRYGKQPMYLIVQGDISINYFVAILYGILSQHIVVLYPNHSKLYSITRLSNRPIILITDKHYLERNLGEGIVASSHLGSIDAVVDLKDFTEKWSHYDYHEKVLNRGNPNYVIDLEFEDFHNYSEEYMAMIIVETFGDYDEHTAIKINELLHSLSGLMKDGGIINNDINYTFLPINYFPRLTVLYPLLLGKIIRLWNSDVNSTLIVHHLEDKEVQLRNAIIKNSTKVLLLANQFEAIFNKYLPFAHKNFWQIMRKYWITRFIFKTKLKMRLNQLFPPHIEEVVIVNSHLNRSIDQILSEIDFKITVTYGNLRMGVITYSPWFERDTFSRGKELTKVRWTIEDPNSEDVGQIVIHHHSQFLNELVITNELGKVANDQLYIYSNLLNLVKKSDEFELYPEVIEDVLNTIDYIKESIVLGVELEDGKHKIMAFVNPSDPVYLSELTDLEYKQVLNEINTKLNKELPIYCELDNIVILSNKIYRSYNGEIKRQFYQKDAIKKIHKLLATTP